MQKIFRCRGCQRGMRIGGIHWMGKHVDAQRSALLQKEKQSDLAARRSI